MFYDLTLPLFIKYFLDVNQLFIYDFLILIIKFHARILQIFVVFYKFLYIIELISKFIEEYLTIIGSEIL